MYIIYSVCVAIASFVDVPRTMRTASQSESLEKRLAVHAGQLDTEDKDLGGHILRVLDRVVSESAHVAVLGLCGFRRKEGEGGREDSTHVALQRKRQGHGRKAGPAYLEVVVRHTEEVVVVLRIGAKDGQEDQALNLGCDQGGVYGLIGSMHAESGQVGQEVDQRDVVGWRDRGVQFAAGSGGSGGLVELGASDVGRFADVDHVCVLVLDIRVRAEN